MIFVLNNHRITLVNMIIKPKFIVLLQSGRKFSENLPGSKMQHAVKNCYNKTCMAAEIIHYNEFS